MRIALPVFGPKKLPKCGKGIGEDIGGLKAAIDIKCRRFAELEVGPSRSSRSSSLNCFHKAVAPKSVLNEYDCRLGTIRSGGRGKRRSGACPCQQEWGCCCLRAARREIRSQALPNRSRRHA
ncbi:MAG: twin-arginine translocase TatA/TatE family subunit [Candidatus Korobacteraceae bacterium]